MTKQDQNQKYAAEEQAANREKWVAALRSGDFQQARGALRTGDNESEAFCCLGVACELAVEDGVITRLRSGYSGLGGLGWPDDRLLTEPATAALPEAVQDWLGVTTDYGELVNPIRLQADLEGSSETLVALNDGLRYSFEQIADLIEAGGVVTQ